MPNPNAGRELACLGCGKPLRATTKFRLYKVKQGEGQKRNAVPGIDFCEPCGILAAAALRNYFNGKQLARGKAGEKYSHVVISGIEFKQGEPWFLIRGQDCTAPAAIEAYYQLIKAALGPAHAIAKSSRAFLLRIREWQRDNPNLVKEPD